jgi:mono/diheme cytochrome c family protein
VRAAFLTLLATTAFVAAGCGAVAHLSATSGDPVKGKPLFKSTCGSCHALADAGTTGTIGPNLDDAFKYDKKQGFDESTIRDVVRGQIAYATTDTGAGLGGKKPPGVAFPGMPDNLLRGQDAKDVAAYVAKCSGVPKCGL